MISNQREVRQCTPKSTVTDTDLRTVTAFVVFSEATTISLRPGDYPTSEPERVTADKLVRCYRTANGDPNNTAQLIFVRDLTDAQFQSSFDFTDTQGTLT